MTKPLSSETVVPCGDCRKCCIGEQIIVSKKDGDNPALYAAKVPGIHGITGERAWVIPHKPGTKECWYLGEAGCTIHDHAPVMCRAFSCVNVFLSLDRAERRRRERDMPGSKELFDRGRELAVQMGLAK